MPPEAEDPSSPSDKGSTRPAVTWRGIVDIPADAPSSTGRKEKVMAQLSTMGPSEVLTRRRKRGLLIASAVAVVALLIVTCAHIVTPGSVAVPVTFGAAQPALSDGLHFTLPWPITNTYDMNVQTQNYTMTAADIPGTDDPVLVLGLDGASATVQATLLFHLDPGRASDVYRDVGTDFAVKVVQPTARNCIRTEFADYDIVAAATGSLHEVQEHVRTCIADKIEPVGIDLQDLQIREVNLGDQVQTAIDNKVSAGQDVERAEFEKDRAEIAAEITRVQAGATADAQLILACGGTSEVIDRDGEPITVIVPNPPDRCNPAQLTPEMLQYNYIKMLQDALSSGSNTIILGSDGTQTVVPTVDAAPTTAP